MKNVFCCAIIFLFMTGSAFSQEDLARQVAQNFLSFIESSKKIESLHAIEKNQIDPSLDRIHCGWIVTLTEGGYLLLGVSKNHLPVKGYSLQDEYDALPLPYRTFIETELELHARMDQQALQADRSLQAVFEQDAAQQAWAFLLDWDPAHRTRQGDTSGTELLTTKWNQKYPYNKLLPEIDGQNVAAGCTNIAIAQVMKYHEHPARGMGTAGYEWNGQELSTILYHPYYWQNMPDTLGSTTEEYLQDEVAILIKDLGIVNETVFGLDGSSAYVHMDALVQFFGYSNTLSLMDNTDSDSFFSTLTAQIDLSQPVLLSFPGHLVVVDGYAADDPTGRNFHVNMGWGGAEDNYYYLDQTVETEWYDFAPDLQMYYNIKPCSGPDCEFPVTEPAIQDVPPVFVHGLKDEVLVSGTDTTVKLRIDARDANNDNVALAVTLSNSDTISAVLENDVLTVKHLNDVDRNAVGVRVSATANNLVAAEEFFVLVLDEKVSYGAHQVLTGELDPSSEHQVILGGPSKIYVDRGYANQACFLDVRSNGNSVVSGGDGTQSIGVPAIDHVFDPGVYTIVLSIRFENTYYSEGGGYVVRINAPEADFDVTDALHMLGIHSAQIHFTEPGDVNGDNRLTLDDKILNLKILVHQEDAPVVDQLVDVNNDGRIGIEELVIWPSPR